MEEGKLRKRHKAPSNMDLPTLFVHTGGLLHGSVRLDDRSWDAGRQDLGGPGSFKNEARILAPRA